MITVRALKTFKLHGVDVAAGSHVVIDNISDAEALVASHDVVIVKAKHAADDKPATVPPPYRSAFGSSRPPGMTPPPFPSASHLPKSEPPKR